MLKIINLEKGLPAVYEALDTLEIELVLAKEEKEPCAVVVHGYGKRTQGGGKIKAAARERLAKLKNEGRVKEIIFGEDMSHFDEKVMRLRYIRPELEAYVGKRNLGVTLVVF